MRTVRLPLLRGALFIIALAAISILLMGRGDNPAQATSFDPFSSVRVSDPTPGANADLIVDFSLNGPDSFPNITNKPAIQFIPRQWDIHVPETEEEELARIGGISGTFNTLTYIGALGFSPCTSPVPVDFTMFDSTPDTGYDPATGAYDPAKLASSLDLGGDAHPMGAGFSGQFVDDLNFATFPSDYGLPLITFNADEKFSVQYSWQGSFTSSSGVYRDAELSGQTGFNKVSAGDTRLQVSVPLSGQFAAGSVVAAGDPDVGRFLKPFNPSPWQRQRHDEGVAANGQMDPGEHVYYDDEKPDSFGGGPGSVSDGDRRLFVFEDQPWNSAVDVRALAGGVTRYPDFLNEMFPPEVIGNPLARQFGQSRVLFNPVSMNLVTFRPGQLPGYPASLGYPTVVIVLNPLQFGQDPVFVFLTNDLCTPLTLTSTNFGVSKDNPETAKDETGQPRLTNPKSEKDHVFTLVVESLPDADDDGIENLLDTCPRDANIRDLDSRSGLLGEFVNPGDPDQDGLDAACDPMESPPADWGAALVPFNADEKATTDWSFGNAFATRIYRDNDSSGRVSVGDDRLYHPDLAPGVVQPGDPGINEWLFSFTDVGRYPWEHFKHAENVAANGRYDPGENVYVDRDDSGDVGHDENYADGRMLFEGSMEGQTGWEVGYMGTSAFGITVFYGGVVDEDQDSYSNRGDNCAVVANGLEVLNVEIVPLRSVEFFVVTRGDLIGPDDQTDTDGDGIGDACEGAEHGSQCLNDVDDDGDGVVNDGCPADRPGFPSVPTFGFGESVIYGGDFGWCQDNIDNDGDGVVNDGCPRFPQYGAEGGAQCDNDTDDNGNGRINEGCPTVRTGGAPETGDQCNNAGDDDGDGLVNDGCPAVDPGDYAKMTPDGHVHQFTIERTVTIFKHGVKLDDLNGPESVALDGSGSYRVALENKSDSAEEIQVALRVVEGCGAVSGPSSVHANKDAGVNADFTVDFSGCAAGEYTVQADACHAGDPAPTGLFDAGACPGASDVPPAPSAQLSFSGATASSEAFGAEYGAPMAIDNNFATLWCTVFEPGVYIQASFASPVSIEQVDIENSMYAYGYAFVTGTLSFSNGFSQDVTLTEGAGSFSVPLQSGVEWVRFTGAAEYGYVCISELKATGLPPAVGDTNLFDDAPRSMTVKVGTP